MNTLPPAAFKACFTDWRLIKGRKVVQLVFEIDLDQSDAAYRALGGMPSPAESVWCGIARLDPAAQEQPRQEPADKPAARLRKAVSPDKRMAQQAGILCADPRFWAFLREQGAIWVCDEETTIRYVRKRCGVKSRSDIVPGTEAARIWDDVYGKYRAWELAPA